MDLPCTLVHLPRIPSRFSRPCSSFERLEDAENCIRALRRSKDLHPSFSKVCTLVSPRPRPDAQQQVHKIPVRNITPSAPLIPTSRIGLYPPPPLRSQTSPGVLTTLTLTDTVNLNVNGSPRLDLGLSPQFLDLPSSPVSLPELEQTADVAVIGLPMHVDSAVRRLLGSVRAVF